MCSNSSQLQRNSLVALEQKHFLLHILGMCRHLLPRPQNSQRPWQISMQTGRRKINRPNNLFTKNFLSLSLAGSLSQCIEKDWGHFVPRSFWSKEYAADRHSEKFPWERIDETGECVPVDMLTAWCCPSSTLHLYPRGVHGSITTPSPVSCVTTASPPPESLALKKSGETEDDATQVHAKAWSHPTLQTSSVLDPENRGERKTDWCAKLYLLWPIQLALTPAGCPMLPPVNPKDLNLGGHETNPCNQET